MKQIWANRFLLLVLFLLPWQTHFLFRSTSITDEISAYGTFSLSVTEAILLFVVFLRGRPRFPSQYNRVIQAMYFFLATIFFSLTFTSFFQIGLFHLLSILFAVSLFIILCDERTSIRYACMAFVAGLILPACLGWVQILTGYSPASTWLGIASQQASTLGTAGVETQGNRLLRAYGSFPHPNIFGGYLAVGLFFLGWGIRFVRSTRERFLFTIPLVILIPTFVMTFSRSAWLALSMSVLCLIGLMIFRKRFPPLYTLPLLIVGVVTLLSTILVFSPQIFSRVQSSSRLEKISLEERVSQYQQFTDVLRRNPFFGVGPGAYTFALAEVFPEKDVWAYQPIHNTPLLLLAELGVVGFIALFYLLLRIDQVSTRVAKRANGMFALSLSVLLIVLSLFDHYLWSLWSGLALSAVILACILKWTLEESE